MKKLLGLTSLLIIAGIASPCFADSFTEGKAAYAEKNYTEAITLFTKACEQGNAKACFNLGSMYENGEGTAQNKYQASTLYAQACRAKESLACSNMGLRYDTP